MVPARRHDRDGARDERTRILEAGRHVFVSEGATAPLADVAMAAGLELGVVQRSFDTEDALIKAIVRDDVQKLVDEAGLLGAAADPTAAFFELLDFLLVRGRTSRGLRDALASSGIDVPSSTADLTVELAERVTALLERAQQAGGVRRDVGVTEVMAVVAGTLTATGLHAGDADVQHRVETVLFDGLKPPG